MNLTALTYIAAAAVALLGIVGQWQADPWPDVWRVPAASLLIGLLLEEDIMKLGGLLEFCHSSNMPYGGCTSAEM